MLFWQRCYVKGMKTEQTGPLKRVVLVSTPWPLYSRPSIQLGTLKAYLRRDFPELKVHALHVYLKVAESIGYKLYGAISERTWLAETVYGALLHPERTNEIETLFCREVRGKPDLRNVDFKTLTLRVKEASELPSAETDTSSPRTERRTRECCPSFRPLVCPRSSSRRCP